MALNFNGSSQYITIPHHADFNLANNFSIRMLVKFDALGVFPTLVEKSGAYTLYTHVDGTLYIDFFATGYRNTSSGVFSTGNFYDVVLTYDSGDVGNELKLYINSVSQVLSSASIGNPPVNSNDILIANSNPPYSSWLDGTEADVRFYGKTLSQSDIDAIYAKFVAGTYDDTITDSLISRFLFSEKESGQVADGGAGTIIDMTSGHNGTPTASPLYADPYIVLAAPLPGKIANVAATDGTYNNKVRITWDADADADDYNIYRAASESGSYALIDSGITDLYYDDSTVVPGTVYWYKVSGSNATGEGELSDPDDGYAVIAYPIVYDEPYIKRIQVTIFGNMDITAYVSKIITVKEEKTFQRKKLIDNEITLDVSNFDNFFSVDNAMSNFNGLHYLYEPIQIKDVEGNIIWDGVITDIIRDHATKLAKIKSQSIMSKFLKTIIAYTSSGYETPGDAFKNICAAYSFTDYDHKSVEDSIIQYTAAGVGLKCYFNLEDNITFGQAIEKLADFGCADIYIHKNKIYFKHWKEFSGGVKVELEEKDLRKAPLVSDLYDDIVNDYRIGYSGDGEVPATDANSNNIGSLSRSKNGTQSLPDMDCSDEQQIVFENKATAIYIGECYIRRTHKTLSTNPRALRQIDFELSADHRDWIDLQTFFRMTLSDENWTDKLFEVFFYEIDYNNNNIKLTAYETEE